MDFTSHPLTGKLVLFLGALLCTGLFYVAVSSSYNKWQKSERALRRMSRQVSAQKTLNESSVVSNADFLSLHDTQVFLQSVITFCRDNHLKINQFKPQKKAHQLSVSIQLSGPIKTLKYCIKVLESSVLVYRLELLSLQLGKDSQLDLQLDIPLLKQGEFKMLSAKDVLTERVPAPVKKRDLGWFEFDHQKWRLVWSAGKYFWE